MDAKFGAELEDRSPGTGYPAVFLSGNLLGGYDEVVGLNESGSLMQILKGCELASERQTAARTRCGVLHPA